MELSPEGNFNQTRLQQEKVVIGYPIRQEQVPFKNKLLSKLEENIQS